MMMLILWEGAIWEKWALRLTAPPEYNISYEGCAADDDDGYDDDSHDSDRDHDTEH